MSEIIEIKNDKLKVGISTLGSELMYVEGANGTQFLWDGNPDVWNYRAIILFPICGGLKEDKYIFDGNEYTLSKHGFARQSEFDGKMISETKAEFTLKSNEDTLKYYPFEFELKVVFELQGNKLVVTNQVNNLSDKKMYFSIGAHEGYYCPEGIEDYYIEFDEPQTLDSYILNGNLLEENSVRIIENETKLPLNYDYFAVDALVFKDIKFHKAALVHKNSSKKVTVEFNDSNYFLLWTKPNANYICLEPWNGIQDGMDADFDFVNKEGIECIDKGECSKITHTIEFNE